MDATVTACALDIDELVEAFVAIGGTRLGQMKELWTSRSFSFIHEARPKDVMPSFFMQCLYSSALLHVSGENSMHWKLGALYVLYILFETQCFQPRFKIYLSLEDLESLRLLLKQFKSNCWDGALMVFRKMFADEMFLYGSVAVNHKRIADAAHKLSSDAASRLHHTRTRFLSSAPLQQHLQGNLVDESLLERVINGAQDYSDAKSQIFTVENGLLLESDGGLVHLNERRSGLGDYLRGVLQSWIVQRAAVRHQPSVAVDSEETLLALPDKETRDHRARDHQEQVEEVSGDDCYDSEAERALVEELDSFLDEK